MTKFWGPCFPKGQNFRWTIRQVKIAAEPSDNTTGPGAAFRGSNQLRYPQCSRKLYAPAVEKFGIVNTLAPIRQTILFYGWPHPIWGCFFWSRSMTLWPLQTKYQVLHRIWSQYFNVMVTFWQFCGIYGIDDLEYLTYRSPNVLDFSTNQKHVSMWLPIRDVNETFSFETKTRHLKVCSRQDRDPDQDGFRDVANGTAC